MVLILGLAVLALMVLVGVIVVLASNRGGEVINLRPPMAGQQQPGAETPEQLVRAGRKIEAIKRYRELTGLGLREAKDAIDAMAHSLETGRPGSLPPKSSILREVNDSEIEQQIRSGHLIDAIKLYREKTGVGLKEAKDAVEAWRDRIRAS